MDARLLRALCLDMDGVLYRGHALPGAAEVTAVCEELDLDYLCLTNNSSQLPERFEERLAALGITMPAAHIITSSTAAATVLRDRFPAGTTVCAIGMEGLRAALFADGYFVPAAAEAQVVVVGVDFEVTYEKLKVATLALRRGAVFIATNADRTFPSAEGLIPGAGTLVAALQAASDRVPTVIGKPQPAMFEAALLRLGCAPHEVLMVGDRLDTDIAGAQALGINTAYVATGVSSWEEVAAWAPPPTLALPDLAAVLEWLRKERAA